MRPSSGYRRACMVSWSQQTPSIAAVILIHICTRVASAVRASRKLQRSFSFVNTFRRLHTCITSRCHPLNAHLLLPANSSRPSLPILRRQRPGPVTVQIRRYRRLAPPAPGTVSRFYTSRYQLTNGCWLAGFFLVCL